MVISVTRWQIVFKAPILKENPERLPGHDLNLKWNSSYRKNERERERERERETIFLLFMFLGALSIHFLHSWLFPLIGRELM